VQNLTPLRYPGGKARLATYVQEVLRQNHLCDAHYVEPYAGGASVALALLLNEYASHIHINDIDRSIFAFWHSVLNETDALCRLIENAKLSVTEWKRQRALQRVPRNSDLLSLGFSTLYLNRTNRSGIIWSGGPIGGPKQNGLWRLDARFYRETLVDRIRAIAAYRDRISVTNLDAGALLVQLLPRLSRKSLIYLDPPYYVKGKRRLYSNFYEHADHAAVSDLLSECPHPWLVSYDDVPEIRALYKGYRRRAYSLSYTAQERYKGAEIIFFSRKLAIPIGTNLP
jgi:DNA adenine methylase